MQALGIAGYVLIFVTLATHAGSILPAQPFEHHPAFGMMAFLIAFVVSALVCSSLALGYPAHLFFGGERKAALHVVLWTAVWLVVAFIAIFALGIGLTIS